MERYLTRYHTSLRQAARAVMPEEAALCTTHRMATSHASLPSPKVRSCHICVPSISLFSEYCLDTEPTVHGQI